MTKNMPRMIATQPPSCGRGLPASGGAEGDQGQGEGAEVQNTQFLHIKLRGTQERQKIKRIACGMYPLEYENRIVYVLKSIIRWPCKKSQEHVSRHSGASRNPSVYWG
jgi:hypothetical protein